MLKYMLIYIVSVLIASVSQIILKTSSGKTYDSFIREYLNFKVIAGYAIMFAGMFINVYVYSRGVEYKNGPVMESIGNIWVVILSFLFFGEPVTKKKIIGNILIIAGIFIFYM